MPMSVPSGDRNESTVEFIYNARRLQIYTMQRTKDWPTRWRYDLSSPLVQDARYVYQEVKAGNKIWPTNAHETQVRRDHFLNAQGRLDSMIGQIEIACELMEVKDKTLHEWSAMAAKEISLLTEVMKSDRKRFRFEDRYEAAMLSEAILSYLKRRWFTPAE